jgi:hypothetical protein
LKAGTGKRPEGTSMKVLTLPNFSGEARSMKALQNRWYNSLTEQLGLDRSMFQIARPALPIAPSSLALWDYQNVIPPYSLTFDRTVGVDSFFGEYAAFAIQMSLPAGILEQDIGRELYENWLAFVAQQIPPPPENQLPALFLQWAMVYAPEKAQIGASDLSSMVLINAAQQALSPYLGPQATAPDFLGTYQQLLRTLGSSSSRSIFFSSGETSDNVSDTWTGGKDSGLAGLWSGGSVASRLSLRFCQSLVWVKAQFKAFALIPVTPGPWYNSALFQVAYSNQTSPPWPTNPNPNWEDLFGPEGSILRLPASLIAVDGIQATVTSDASYSANDQEIIRSNVAKGVWPFYAPDSAIIHNAVTFDDQGIMSITTTTQPEHSLFIGANILSTPRYLGHIPR